LEAKCLAVTEAKGTNQSLAPIESVEGYE